MQSGTSKSYSSSKSCFKLFSQMYREEGVRGLYRVSASEWDGYKSRSYSTCQFACMWSIKIQSGDTFLKISDLFVM